MKASPQSSADGAMAPAAAVLGESFSFSAKWVAEQLEAGPYVASQAEAVDVTITVRTPTLCIPDTSDRPGPFISFYLLNLAMPLLSYLVRLVLLTFVLLSLLLCYVYNPFLIPTFGYRFIH